ncbi:MAG: hypothetical protein U5J99_05740 [Parvularculaceae bacterium]|nr:hypothetical protein [Parvularculaceae bacterium]
MAEAKSIAVTTTPAEGGKGLGLLSLVVGLAAGGAVYAITDYLGAERPAVLPVVLTQTVCVFAAGWLLLAERGRVVSPILPAAIIAAVLAIPTWFFASIDIPPAFDLEMFPAYFWSFIAGPLSFYLMLTIAKSALETGVPPHYPSVFFHGITMPLIGGGAVLFAGLALLLLYAWAALLKQMDVAFFSELFDEPWFILPFLGAIGGLSIAMIRSQQSVLGALRFILLLFSRIAMPIMAVFSVTFLVVLAMRGPDAVLGMEAFMGRPSGVVLFIAFAGMLIFNGVYQNGEGAPPPWWLRISTIIAIAAFPVYAGFAAWALWVRIGDYGLTPPRITGLAMNGLAFAYSIVLIAGLVSEINWKAKRWMAPVASLNTGMAALWLLVLLLISSPMLNSWAISAKSQERILLSNKIAAKDFDFGYLKFRLGKSGEAALARIEEAATGRADAAVIRAGIARARAALSYWEYQNPDLVRPEPEPGDAAIEPPAQDAQPGPMDLELNPDGADVDTPISAGPAGE